MRLTDDREGFSHLSKGMGFLERSPSRSGGTCFPWWPHGHAASQSLASLALASLALLAVALLCGCAGYRLGPTNGLAPGSRSIQVNLFQNQTMEPRLSEAIAAALRQDLQRDGTFTLNTEGDADLVVNGVLLRYGRLPLTYQRRDILSARDFRVAVTARITVTERHSGRVVLNREINGATMVRIDPEQNALGIGSDQTSAERQALPLLATDFARQVTALLVDGEW